MHHLQAPKTPLVCTAAGSTAQRTCTSVPKPPPHTTCVCCSRLLGTAQRTCTTPRPPTHSRSACTAASSAALTLVARPGRGHKRKGNSNGMGHRSYTDKAASTQERSKVCCGACAQPHRLMRQPMGHAPQKGEHAARAEGAWSEGGNTQCAVPHATGGNAPGWGWARPMCAMHMAPHAPPPSSAHSSQRTHHGGLPAQQPRQVHALIPVHAQRLARKATHALQVPGGRGLGDVVRGCWGQCLARTATHALQVPGGEG